MGFDEIRAAFAAQAPGQVGPGVAPQNAVQPPAPAAPVQFTPSPFGAPSVNAFAPTPQAVLPQPGPAIVVPAPTQPTFQFTPPAGFNPASAPPINPPGERAALAAPAAVPVVVGATPGQTPGAVAFEPPAPNPPVAAAPAEAPGVTAAPTSPAPIQPSAAGFSPPSAPAEPKRRGRKPGAKNAGGMPGVVAEAPALFDGDGRRVGELPSLAADGAAIATMPPDGSSVEDIVSELFARGVSSVHLTFTKDGK